MIATLTKINTINLKKKKFELAQPGIPRKKDCSLYVSRSGVYPIKKRSCCQKKYNEPACERGNWISFGPERAPLNSQPFGIRPTIVHNLCMYTMAQHFITKNYYSRSPFHSGMGTRRILKALITKKRRVEFRLPLVIAITGNNPAGDIIHV